QPATAGGVDGVALELADRVRLLVHVGEQPARRLAVEAGGRDQLIVPLDAPRGPAAGVDLDPVVPFVRRRGAGQQPGGAALRPRRRLRKQPQRNRYPFDPTDVWQRYLPPSSFAPLRLCVRSHAKAQRREEVFNSMVSVAALAPTSARRRTAPPGL